MKLLIMQTTCSNTLNFAFCPHSVFVRSIQFSQETATVSLDNINKLGSVAETGCVSCEVQTECLSEETVFNGLMMSCFLCSNFVVVAVS
jgi:hypothetical protein